ncbi:MAG: hypothetical protein LBI06_02975 [Treponema sp.]|nr:hypothetical protein [Treponema sp.]
MGKIIVFLAIFFLSLPMAFADDNLGEFEDIYFAWQFSYYKFKGQAINFANLNPLFFHNGNYLLRDSWDNIRNLKSGNSRNNNAVAQGEENLYGLLLFFAGMFAPDLDALNRQYPGRFNHILERERDERLIR